MVDGFHQSRNVDVACKFIRQTDAAVLIKSSHDETVWLPKSKVGYADDWDDVEEGKEISIAVPEWLANQEGLI